MKTVREEVMKLIEKSWKYGQPTPDEVFDMMVYLAEQIDELNERLAEPDESVNG